MKKYIRSSQARNFSLLASLLLFLTSAYAFAYADNCNYNNSAPGCPGACSVDPNGPGCPDTCAQDPNAPGCPVGDSCQFNSMAPGCGFNSPSH
jgi:hypothetical protein